MDIITQKTTNYCKIGTRTYLLMQSSVSSPEENTTADVFSLFCLLSDDESCDMDFLYNISSNRIDALDFFSAISENDVSLLHLREIFEDWGVAPIPARCFLKKAP